MNKNKNKDEDIEFVEEDSPKEQIKKLKKRIEEYREKSSEYLDGWRRAKADYINLKKETEKKGNDFARFAEENLIKDILPIIDGLEEALRTDQNTPKENRKENAWTEGIKNIHGRLMDVLNRRGVEVIESEGRQFNAEEHEALLSQDTENKSDDGVVLEEVQKGYKIKDKVLRPSKVKVAVYKT